MPDRRRHRGAHSADASLFADEAIPVLRRAVGELSWLLSRGYAEAAALELVGNRHALRSRQREALRRCACSDEARDRRRSRRLDVARSSLAGARPLLDGFNCLVTSEVALGGGVVLVGRDGSHRDVASLHGSYRRVEETREAALLIGRTLDRAGASGATWLLDRPVSNSGRLRSLLLELAEGEGWAWSVELEQDPDSRLAAADGPVATSDSWILDRCRASLDLPGAVAAGLDGAWIADLRPREA